MRRLPSIDMHAHVDSEIDPCELAALNAVVFAATRSLDEAERAAERSDSMTIWGVGCHPGLIRAQEAFDVSRFRELVRHSAYAAELGLDGDSRVPMSTQKRTLEAALGILAESPRLTSLHSYRATRDILELIGRHPQPGVILHWWLGSREETELAIELGCYFSVNRSSIRKSEVLNQVPVDRILPETDHPYGDRGGEPRRPGELGPVEAAVAEVYGLAPDGVRELFWRNLNTISADARVRVRLPSDVRIRLMAL